MIKLALRFPGDAKLRRAISRRIFQWHVDQYDGLRLRGWVGCKAAPLVPTLVALRSKDKVIASLVADQPRPDVSALGFGPTGFSYNFSSYGEEPISIMVNNPAAGGRWLTIESGLVPPAGFGSIESLQLDSIVGWAVAYMARPDEEVEVFLLKNDEKVASGRLDLDRPDIMETYHLSRSRLGFHLRLPLSATAFCFERCKLMASTSASSFLIENPITFEGCDPAFERVMTFDPATSTWN